MTYIYTIHEYNISIVNGKRMTVEKKMTRNIH